MNVVHVLTGLTQAAALALALPVPAAGQAAERPGPIAAAEALFKEGKFAEAEALFREALEGDPGDPGAAAGLGRVAYLRNDLEAAETWLRRAREARPEDRSVLELLAGVHYRRDDFERAAPLYRALEREAVARKLESFKGLAPYRMEGGAGIARVPFVHTDPLPLVKVRVNGGEEVNFLIDTGGSEVYLDTELAKKLGVPSFGSTTGTYGGGRKAPTEHGRADSLSLGGVTVRNLPVLILGTRPFSAAARGLPVDGILGTVLLSHFLATLDYPKGELVLRTKNAENLKEVERTAARADGAVIPFWMAGDHVMVAWGRANASGPLLWFIDTGLAGGGFVCPESTLAEAGVKLPEGRASEGVGGGGRVTIVPFVVDELSLGPVKETKVTGIFGPFPPALESSEGFRIAGIVSHQFFRPYAVTFDFTGMRLFLRGVTSAR